MENRYNRLDTAIRSFSARLDNLNEKPFKSEGFYTSPEENHKISLANSGYLKKLAEFKNQVERAENLLKNTNPSEGREISNRVLGVLTLLEGAAESNKYNFDLMKVTQKLDDLHKLMLEISQLNIEKQKKELEKKELEVEVEKKELEIEKSDIRGLMANTVKEYKDQQKIHIIKSIIFIYNNLLKRWIVFRIINN